MSHKLIDRNPDLTSLRADGYNIDVHEGYLVVRDVPYVTSTCEVQLGILVAKLDLSGDVLNRPQDHTIFFAGEYPCKSDGKPIEAIRANTDTVRISGKLTVQHRFSSKPPRGHYESYHEKIQTYAAILAGHAAVLDPTATPQTFRVVEPEDDDSPFNYIDTASARAEVNMVTRKLAVEKLAIVGLGGTGSYVLDLLSKTPAKQLHLFDGDKFGSHNAFRAPGAASIEDLRKQPYKVDYFKGIYERLHRGIIPHSDYVDESNIDQLRDMACVFLCIDGGKGKRFIVDKLEEFGVAFIDVGMGLYVTNETIGGILRVTLSDDTNRAAARARMSLADRTEADEYDKNIQVADLNALNATLAVIRWKKMRGFYFNHKQERSSSYTIGSNMLLSEDIDDPNKDD